MITMLIHVFGISDVLYHGGTGGEWAIFRKFIPFFVDTDDNFLGN